MKLLRCPENPIIEPKDVKPSRAGFEVIGTFNAGVARLGDETILLIRVAEKPSSENPKIALAAFYDAAKGDISLKEFSKDDSAIDFSDPRLFVTPAETYLTSISHLRIARSKDGIKFKIEDKPALAASNKYESFGVEDARISYIDDTYYISYVTVSPFGAATCLASTEDFKSFNRYGVIFCPDNKDVVIFPERINGKYYAFHRPISPLFKSCHMWIAESVDMKCWGNHRYLMGLRDGFWDESRIGAGTVPVRTEAGWLEIYHGADKNNRYCLGAVLTDINQPYKVIARTDEPILQPQTDYETSGFFANVVFTCGLLCEDGKLKIYYGVTDTAICYAELKVKDVLDKLVSCV
ncbi:MAG: glycoside hydrolase family 130 protein [Planctomycetes bacterium]|nr:glycoside hydrolase family 130 protein [Planctomycetota bacterium]